MKIEVFESRTFNRLLILKTIIMCVTKIIKKEFERVEKKPVFGGFSVIAHYTITTECENVKNIYEVSAEIRGLATMDLYYEVNEVKPLTNNEHTLTKESLIDLLDL